MADKLTPRERSANMAAIRSKNMKPELIVRKWLFSRGYRYRVHAKGLAGKPDLVFSSRRKVIFVHGCFWHQHDDPECLDGRMPKTRLEYWDKKLSGNQERDRRNVLSLQQAGWKVMIVWECQTKDMGATGPQMAEFLRMDRS